MITSIRYTRTPSTASKLLLLVIAMLLLSSCCKMKPQSKVIVEEGHLYTPEGKYKFEYLSYSDLQDIDPRYRDRSPEPQTNIIVETEKFKIVANPAYGGGGVWLIYPDEELNLYKDIEINANNSYFETRHNGKLIKTGQAVLPPPYLSLDLHHRAIPYIDFNSVGIGQMKDEASREGYTFRYVIPFTMNKTEYKIDVTISFKPNSYVDCTDWHFPGSP